MTDPAKPDPATPDASVPVRGPRGRRGAAARKPSKARSTTAPARQPRTRTPIAAENTGPPATLVASRPRTAEASVAELARTAIAALDNPEVRRLIEGYRGQRFPDDAEWAEVADLVRLGMAAVAPTNRDQTSKLGWVLGLHARVHLDADTSRTVTGWYGTDAVETTLAASLDRVDGRSLTTNASRLRRVSAALVPATAPSPAKFQAYEPRGPYGTDDLERYLDFAAEHPNREMGERLATLIWVIVGAGPWDRELSGLSGESFTLARHALMLRLPGDGRDVAARSVAVHHAAEAPLLQAAERAGTDSLWSPLTEQNGLASRIIRRAGVPGTLPPLTAGRLRATWLALVVGAHAPMTALLPAAGVKGERTFGRMVGRVAPIDEAGYARALRGTDQPLPGREQLLAAGPVHPAPQVPLR